MNKTNGNKAIFICCGSQNQLISSKMEIPAASLKYAFVQDGFFHAKAIIIFVGKAHAIL